MMNKTENTILKGLGAYAAYRFFFGSKESRKENYQNSMEHVESIFGSIGTERLQMIYGFSGFLGSLIAMLMQVPNNGDAITFFVIAFIFALIIGFLYGKYAGHILLFGLGLGALGILILPFDPPGGLATLKAALIVVFLPIAPFFI